MGIRLGQAASREYFFGRAMRDGQPRNEVVADIINDVRAAESHMNTAEMRFPGVQPAERSGWTKVMFDRMERFLSDRARFNYNWRAQAVGNIAQSYSDSLGYTYVSFTPARSDQFQRKPNCVSHLFDACYQFGYASTAAAAEDRQAMGIFTAGMRNALNGAFSVAVDGFPAQPGMEKICCNIGLDSVGSAPALWAPIMAMNANTPHSAYVTATNTILNIANSIIQPPSYPQCVGRGSWPHSASASTSYPPPRPPPIEVRPPPGGGGGTIRPPLADDWVVYYGRTDFVCCLGDVGFRSPHPLAQRADEVPYRLGIAKATEVAADTQRVPLTSQRFSERSSAQGWVCSHPVYDHSRSGSIARINGVLVGSTGCSANR